MSIFVTTNCTQSGRRRLTFRGELVTKAVQGWAVLGGLSIAECHVYRRGAGVRRFPYTARRRKEQGTCPPREHETAASLYTILSALTVAAITRRGVSQVG